MNSLSISDSGLFRTVSDQQQAQSAQNKELGQSDFMRLMLEQIKNQDPFKPMENGDFLAQMAQFSTVNGITEMQESMQNMANGFQASQVLQASSLVGRDVQIVADTFAFEQGKAMNASVELPAYAQNVNVSLFNQQGSLIRTMAFGDQKAGEFNFSFDGLNENGQAVTDQTISVQASFYNGQTQEELPVMMQNRVESVSLGTNGAALLSVEGVGEALLSEVISIRETQ